MSWSSWADGIVAALVPLLVAAGILLMAAAVLVTRRITVGLPILLDLLLAAGLVRLSATSSWSAIASAALIVVIRKLAMFGIDAAVHARTSAPAPRARRRPPR